MDVSTSGVVKVAAVANAMEEAHDYARFSLKEQTKDVCFEGNMGKALVNL